MLNGNAIFSLKLKLSINSHLSIRFIRFLRKKIEIQYIFFGYAISLLKRSYFRFDGQIIIIEMIGCGRREYSRYYEAIESAMLTTYRYF